MQTKWFKDAFPANIAKYLSHNNTEKCTTAVNADISNRTGTPRNIELVELIQRCETNTE